MGDSQPQQSPLTASQLAWPHILAMGEQLLRQPDMAAQCRLILDVARRLAAGRVELWLDESLRRLLDPQEAGQLLVDPPPPALQRVLEACSSAAAAVHPGRSYRSSPTLLVCLLEAGGVRVGGLQLERPGGPPFSDAEQELLEGLATQAAIALQATRQLSIERWRIEQLSLVRQVSAQVADVLDLDELLQRVADLILRTFNYYYVALFTLEPGQEYLRFRSSAGPLQRRSGAAQGSPVVQVRLGEGMVGWVAQHGQEQVAPDVSCNPYYCHTDSLPETRSEVALPLKIGNRVLGVLDVESDQLDDFDETDLLVLRALADNIAVAVRNASLYATEQWRRQVADSLRQVASLNQLDEILAAIVQLTPRLIAARHCSIWLWDDERGEYRLVQACGLPPSRMERLRGRSWQPGDFPLLDVVRQQNQPLSYPAAAKPHTTEARPEWLPEPLLRDLLGQLPDGEHVLYALPVSVRGDVLGVMLLEAAPAFQQTSANWLEAGLSIAQQVAAAVQNDRLQRELAGRRQMERELQLARQIQQTFMPDYPLNLPGWEMAVIWRAAHQVGGDFYDFFELPGRRLGLVIADVADKGIPAALFMALSRAMLRAAAGDEVTPGNVLARVNDLLVPDAQHGMFVTAIYGILSLDTGQFVCANAGHLPPLVWHAGVHQLQRMPKGNIALGVLEGVRFDEHAEVLEPGDFLIMYTDGITEALSARNEFFGEQRLYAIIREVAANSAATLLATIDDALTEFVADQAPSDDMTLLILRRQ